MTEQFDKNTWQTPKWLFRWLNTRFRFAVDGCANAENALCHCWFGSLGDYPQSDNWLGMISWLRTCLKF